MDRSHGRWSALAALAVLCAAGCATSGRGSGELVRKNGTQQGVAFNWHSGADGNHGDISATLDNGKMYNGTYFQITSTTQADTLEPLWAGWSPWWTDWPWAGYASAGPDIITHYSGKVLATLTDENGKRMRCRFQLAHPPSGMAGGGQGKCQLQGGSTIDAYFPRQ